MALTAEDSIIVQKTRELCQTILDHPDFQNVRQNIDAFMADEKAKQEYQSLVERSEELNHKQHQGVKLSDQEINDFQTHRERVVNNPLAANFIRAQQEVHGKCFDNLSPTQLHARAKIGRGNLTVQR